MSAVNAEPEVQYPTIGIFDNSKDDILKMDFSWLNLAVYKLDDNSFEKVVDSISSDSFKSYNQDVIKEFKRDEFGSHPFLFAFVPVDFNIPVAEETFYMIEQVLLIMFPSDFKLHHVVHLDEDEEEPGKYLLADFATYDSSPLYWIKGSHSTINEFHLQFDSSHLHAINSFFKMAWERLGQIDYLSFATNTYISSFSQRSIQMRYVNLCMVLESLTSGATDLTHRISRSCAVINADSREQGMVIYNNVKVFYSVRSRIVHGEVIKKDFSGIFFNLQALVSRTLLELICLNISNSKFLGNLIIQSGFGDKAKLKTDYIKSVFNPEIDALIYVPVKWK